MKSILLALVAVLSPSDTSVLDEIRAAIEHPADYLQTHEDLADRLWASKDPAADPKLPWLVLADRLQDRHLAVELDWRTGKDDLLWSLRQLESYRLLSEQTRSSMATLHVADRLTVNGLRTIASQAASDDVVVAVMDIESDSYVVLLLKRPDYLRASELADKMGFVLKDIREHDPNQF
jgi:hypothetical protein